MKKTIIANNAGVTDVFTRNILDGKRNPNTRKGMAVVLAAADEYANECRAKFISDLMRKWKLNETLYNKKKNTSSGVKGVSWNKYSNKWQSQICIQGKRIHLGYYDSIEKAAEVYRIEKELTLKQKHEKIKPIKFRPFEGTSWHKGNKKWIAQIRISNKNKTIGYFENREKAAEAYRIAKEQAK